jgi:hypothetical protein
MVVHLEQEPLVKRKVRPPEPKKGRGTSVAAESMTTTSNPHPTEHVSAGEVCTIDTAKLFGIDDITINDKYFKPDYNNNVRTFRPETDTEDNRYALCELSADEANAVPSCPLQKGSGAPNGFAFGFTKQFVNNKYVCVTSECPTTFTQEGNKCIKPKDVRASLLSNNLDERWHDWFVIPEYQIGNTYAVANKTKYGPCPKDSLPYYATDPIDAANSSMTGSNDQIDKCIHKNDYFGGKYQTSPSHCPAAWIMRTIATKEDYKHLYLDKLDQLEKTGQSTADMEHLRKSLPTYIDKEIYQSIQKDGFKNSISSGLTSEEEVACNKIYTEERMQNAYDVCKVIKDMGEDAAIKHLMRKNGDSDEALAKIRYARGKQACHAVFCEEDGPIMKVSGGAPLCFPDVEKAQFEESIKKIEEAKAKQAALEATPITSDPAKTQMHTFVHVYLVFFLKIVAIGIFLTLFITKVIVPLIRLIGKQTGFIDPDLAKLNQLINDLSKKYDEQLRNMD